MSAPERFSDLLFNARMALGWTQFQVAYASGISINAYGAYERGQSSPSGRVAREKLRRLADVLWLDREVLWDVALAAGRNAGYNISLTDAQARKEMVAHNFLPDDEWYPGSNESWQGIWLTCRHRDRISLSEIRSNRRKHLMCGDCAVSEPRLDRRNSSEEALKKAYSVCPDFKPLVPYESSSTPWYGIHLVCRREVNPTLSRMMAKHTCCSECGREKSQKAATRARRGCGISGYVGVYPSGRKWMAQVYLNGKAISAGHHSTPERAAQAFDDKVTELGLNRGLNFPRKRKSELA